MVNKKKKGGEKGGEGKRLKIYATVMTTIFLGIWLTAMVAVVQEIIQTFF